MTRETPYFVATGRGRLVIDPWRAIWFVLKGYPGWQFLVLRCRLSSEWSFCRALLASSRNWSPAKRVGACLVREGDCARKACVHAVSNATIANSAPTGAVHFRLTNVRTLWMGKHQRRVDAGAGARDQFP